MAKASIPGWIYILSSPAMPGILKIGHTTRKPEIRAVELSDATGIPCAFVSEFVQAVPDSEAAEATVHRLLSDKRPSPNREFFICSVDEGKAAIAATVAGAKPKGEPPPFAGPLPAGWKPPGIPAVRLASNRAGQIQTAPAAKASVDDIDGFAMQGWSPPPARAAKPVWTPPRRVPRRRGWPWWRGAAVVGLAAVYACMHGVL